MTSRPRPGVFLDRDGTVIEDRHYLSDPAGARLLPGAGEAVARLNRAGLPVILVTNQSGIGRGYFSAEDFEAVQRRVVALLAGRGARVDAVYHCPHAPDDACACRKPAPGLFLRASRELGIDLASSFFVGDRVRDVEPALEWGGSAILLDAGGASEEGRDRFLSAPSLAEAVDLVLARSIDADGEIR